MKVFRGMNWALWLLLVQAMGWFAVGIITLSGVLPIGVIADKVFMVIGSWVVAGVLGMVVCRSMQLERQDIERGAK